MLIFTNRNLVRFKGGRKKMGGGLFDSDGSLNLLNVSRCRDGNQKRKKYYCAGFLIDPEQWVNVIKDEIQ